MISDPLPTHTGRQVEVEARQAQRGGKWSHSGLKRKKLFCRTPMCFKDPALAGLGFWVLVGFKL